MKDCELWLTAIRYLCFKGMRRKQKRGQTSSPKERKSEVKLWVSRKEEKTENYERAFKSIRERKKVVSLLKGRDLLTHTHTKKNREVRIGKGQG